MRAVKTNLLEGAYFALRAASPRTTKEEKAVRWGATFARAEATIEARGGEGSHTLAVAYVPGQGKQVRVDGVDVAALDDLRRQAQSSSSCPRVCFSQRQPGAPPGAPRCLRRRADPAYDGGLRDLNVVLKQRNAHLWRVREARRPTRSTLGSPARSGSAAF